MLSEDSHFIFWIARTCPWLGGKNNFLKVKLYHRVIGGFPFHILNRRNIVSVVPYTQKRLKWNLFKNSFLLHRVIQFSSVQFKKVFMHSEKPIRPPPCLSEVFPTLPLKQFSNSAIHQTFPRRSQFPFTANIQRDEITLIILTSLP